MNRIIDADKSASWTVTKIRKARALMYYWAVRIGGGAVFDLAKEFFR
jgi:hypothetical protein